MQHQWIPAKVGDVIKKVESHYYSEIQNGEHFVVLDVLNGDSTAIVLDRDGKLTSLSFPEEYEVICKAQDLVNEMYSDMRKSSEELESIIAEQKANDTYIDPLEKMLNLKGKVGQNKPPKENRPKGDIYKNGRRVD